MTVETQKAYCHDVLKKLAALDSECIVAGGAPRDWHFGNEGNDLDLYYRTYSSTASKVGDQLQAIGFDTVNRGKKMVEYPTGILTIRNHVKEGFPTVQFIALEGPAEASNFVVKNFDFGICQIWRGAYDNMSRTELFDRDVRDQTLTLRITELDEHQIASVPKRARKLQAKFPGYELRMI